MSTKTELASPAHGSREHFHAAQPAIVLTLDEPQRDEPANSFERDGYTVARGVFDRPSLEIYATYALMLQANNFFGTREGRQGFYDRYADSLMESILLHLQPAMEQATGLSLWPTYSYLRIYETGAALAKHTDRHACEISASLTIGYDAPELWPLWLESDGQPRSITLERATCSSTRGANFRTGAKNSRGVTGYRHFFITWTPTALWQITSSTNARASASCRSDARPASRKTKSGKELNRENTRNDTKR